MSQYLPSDRENQIHLENLRSLQESNLRDVQLALDSCIKMNASTRKAFADILKLGNQIDTSCYDAFVASIRASDKLIESIAFILDGIRIRMNNQEMRDDIS